MVHPRKNYSNPTKIQNPSHPTSPLIHTQPIFIISAPFNYHLPRIPLHTPRILTVHIYPQRRHTSRRSTRIARRSSARTRRCAARPRAIIPWRSSGARPAIPSSPPSPTTTTWWRWPTPPRAPRASSCSAERRATIADATPVSRAMVMAATRWRYTCIFKVGMCKVG